MARNKDALQQLQDNSSYSKSAGEKIDWTYYDTIKLATTTAVHRFFTNPLGSNNKTLADTNLPNAGQLPQGQNLKVHAIKCSYISNAQKTTDDVQLFYNLLNTTTVEIVVPGKDSLGTYRLAELFGMSTMFALTPTTAGDNIPLNMAEYKGVFPLNIPWKIGAVQSFELRMTHHEAVPAGLVDDKIVLGLNGRLIRMS